MKRGFTLIEALIAIAIIGIIVTLVLPHLGNASPDENKIKYLKVYDSLSTVVMNIANDKSLYNVTYETQDAAGNTIAFDTKNYSLLDYSKPLDKHFNDNKYSGSSKFCELLLSGLNGVSNTACSGSTTAIADFNTKYNFTTQDGAAWLVNPYVGNPLPSDEADSEYYNEIIVDINGVDKGPNTIYNSAVPNIVPDRFRFYVNAKGELLSSDEYSQMYSRTRSRWHTKKSEDANTYEAITPATERRKNFFKVSKRVKMELSSSSSSMSSEPSPSSLSSSEPSPSSLSSSEPSPSSLSSSEPSSSQSSLSSSEPSPSPSSSYSGDDDSVNNDCDTPYYCPARSQDDMPYYGCGFFVPPCYEI